MHRCVSRLAERFLSAGLLAPEDADMFVYGLEKRLSFLLVFVPFFLLAVLLMGVSASAAFFLGFFVLRAKTNGVHAPTVTGCLIFSLLLELFFAACLFPLLSPALCGILIPVCIGAVFCLAPYVHPNLPLTEEEIRVLRTQARLRVLALAALSLGAALLGLEDLGRGVTLGMTMAATVLCIPYIYKGGNKENGKRQEPEQPAQKRS